MFKAFISKKTWIFFFHPLSNTKGARRAKRCHQGTSLFLLTCLWATLTLPLSQPTCNFKKTTTTKKWSPFDSASFQAVFLLTALLRTTRFPMPYVLFFPLWYFRAGNLHFLELTKHTLHLGWVHIQPQLISINRLPEQSLSQQLVCLKARLMLIRDYNKSQVSTQFEEHVG